MPKIWEMLDEAYDYINGHSYGEAREVLERILFADPQNVGAWDAYIQICQNEHELQRLRSYVIDTWKARVRNDYLFATKRYVLQRLDEKLNSL